MKRYTALMCTLYSGGIIYCGITIHKLDKRVTALESHIFWIGDSKRMAPSFMSDSSPITWYTNVCTTSETLNDVTTNYNNWIRTNTIIDEAIEMHIWNTNTDLSTDGKHLY